MLISFGLFFLVAVNEQEERNGIFERRAEVRADSVERGLAAAVDALRVVNLLFVTNRTVVSYEQFHTFTQPLLETYPYIKAFAFSRWISDAERPAFEAQMHRRIPGFVISEIVDGQRVPARRKDHYRVVEFYEPVAGNESIFGLDATSRPFQVDMERSADMGVPIATGLFPLFTDHNKELGLRIAMPLYRDGIVPGSVQARREALAGFTVVILRSNELIEKILASAGGSTKNAGLDISVYAAADAAESKLVYRSRTARQQGWQEWAFARLTGSRPQPFVRNFDVAGAPWHLVIQPTSMPVSGNAPWVLLIGLLSTFAATAYLSSLKARTQKIEQQVAERTAELKEVNQHLVEDINARQRLEHTLLLNEERAREMADLSSDWYWELDEDYRFIRVSSDLMGAAGLSPASLMPPVEMGKTPWEQPVNLEVSDWVGHRAILECRLPFKDFEFQALAGGVPDQWISASGIPVYDADGCFKGYRGTSRDVTDRKRAEEALRQSQAELRRLADHMNQVKEEERKRIAREIHDDLGQNLMALRIDLSMAADYPALPPAVHEQIQSATRQIDTTIKAVRAIINDLRPAVLDLGLHAAVDWQAREFERRSGIACHVHIDHEEFKLDEQRATALFRIVQESLSNIMRHARASNVLIEIVRRDGCLLMKIVDDGIGLAPDSAKKPNAFGLTGIKERVHALGGTFSIENAPHRGLMVVTSIRI